MQAINHHYQAYPYDKILRTVTIFTWVPAFGLFLAYSIVTERPGPALSIIPLTASTLLAIAWHALPEIRNRNLIPLLDAVLFAYELLQLIISWVSIGNGHWSSAPATMVGTYGTVFLMLNVGVHGFITGRDFFLVGMLFGSTTCPHCQHEFAARQASQSRLFATLKHGYSTIAEAGGEAAAAAGVAAEGPGLGGERQSVGKDPRPSTDDEAARLV